MTPRDSTSYFTISKTLCAPPHTCDEAAWFEERRGVVPCGHMHGGNGANPTTMIVEPIPTRKLIKWHRTKKEEEEVQHPTKRE